MAQLVEHSPSKGKVLGSNPGEGFARLPEWSKGVVSSSTIVRCAGSNPVPCINNIESIRLVSERSCVQFVVVALVLWSSG